MFASTALRLRVLTALALSSAALFAPAPALGAASSVASSASQSVGASIGSFSGSLKGSSNSSSPAAEVAAGDYQVVAIALVDDGREHMLLTLRAAATQGEIVLELPRQAVEQGRLAPGGRVMARARPYGVEFASGETREAFFLLLDDDWYAELSLRALGS
jgi:hypothetical protein